MIVRTLKALGIALAFIVTLPLLLCGMAWGMWKEWRSGARPQPTIRWYSPHGPVLTEDEPVPEQTAFRRRWYED
jgi:hypothetical protein